MVVSYLNVNKHKFRRCETYFWGSIINWTCDFCVF